MLFPNPKIRDCYSSWSREGSRKNTGRARCSHMNWYGWCSLPRHRWVWKWARRPLFSLGWQSILVTATKTRMDSRRTWRSDMEMTFNSGKGGSSSGITFVFSWFASPNVFGDVLGKAHLHNYLPHTLAVLRSWAGGNTTRQDPNAVHSCKWWLMLCLMGWWTQVRIHSELLREQRLRLLSSDVSVGDLGFNKQVKQIIGAACSGSFPLMAELRWSSCDRWLMPFFLWGFVHAMWFKLLVINSFRKTPSLSGLCQNTLA